VEAELGRLGQALGLRPGEVALQRAQAASDAEAVAALRGQLATSLTSAELTRDALVVHAACLGVGAPAYRAYLTARYQVSDGDAPELGLTEAQFREERERFVRRYREPAIAAGFRAQCQRLERGPAA
jgi:hypothetical protein